MISALWPALGLTAAFVAFLIGYRQMRGSAASQLDVDDLVLLHEAQRREAEGLPPLERLARRLVPSARRLAGPRNLKRLQHLIDEAGRPEGMTVDTVLTRMVWWALLISPLFLLVLLQGQLLSAILLLVIPLIMPLIRIASTQRKRRERIDADFPDFLDVLAVVVTAGVAFRPGIARVADKFGGPVAEEMRLTLAQLGSGASVRQAFTDMRERTGSEAMEQFVTAFLQSDELGVPLADTLNRIAIDLRRTAAQRARQRAARTAPRVTLITSVIFVPAVMSLLVTGVILGSGVDFGELLKGLGVSGDGR